MIKNIVFLFIMLSCMCFMVMPKARLDMGDSLKVIRVNSLSQKIIDKNKIVFEGDVEILVDTSLHIWADSVEISKDTRVVIAKSISSPVVVEDDDTLILADFISLNLATRTGHGDNLKVHLKDGFISCFKAKKIDEKKWHFKNVSYTACDLPKPHWKINLPDVWMKKHMVYLYGLPIFNIPIVTASQKKSNSGFLIPKLFYSRTLGPGVEQEYYWEISKNFDTTLGVNWRKKKGAVFYDEFRHITGSEEFSIFNFQYAREKELHRDRFWLSGKNFHTLKVGNLCLNNLMRIDLGTDKRIGYDFLYNKDAVEDHFYNNFISRVHDKNYVLSISFDNEKIFREKFSFEDSSVFREEDDFKIYRIPHVQLNSSYFPLLNKFYYKQDVFVDQVLAKKKNFNTKLTPNFRDVPTEKDDAVRLFYQGSLLKTFNYKKNVFRLNVDPNFQMRSRLKDYSTSLANRNVFEGRFIAEGAYRAFVKMGAEWSLPESVTANNDYSFAHYLQPVLKWDYVPKFEQEHWYNNDVWDREYAKNNLSFSLRNNLHLKDVRLGMNFGLGYDFYNRDDIFMLRRSPFQEHFLPLKIETELDTEHLRASFVQEYDVKNPTLLESSVEVGFLLNKLEIYGSFSYQNPRLQRSRELLSDIPSFANIGCRLPIYKNIIIGYDSSLYSPSNSFVGVFRNSDALLHRVRVDYKAHCWGMALGFEEKRFRREGKVKSEQSYFLSFRIDSIGSFVHHFRKDPEILHAPSDY